MKSYKPVGQNILIRRIVAPNNSLSDGGLILPEIYAQEQSPTYVGEVLAVGRDVNPEITIGKRIILPSYHGLMLENPDDKQQLLVNSKDVIGFVE